LKVDCHDNRGVAADTWSLLTLQHTFHLSTTGPSIARRLSIKLLWLQVDDLTSQALLQQY
jgi:hypothetical protein